MPSATTFKSQCTPTNKHGGSSVWREHLVSVAIIECTVGMCQRVCCGSRWDLSRTRYRQVAKHPHILLLCALPFWHLNIRRSCMRIACSLSFIQKRSASPSLLRLYGLAAEPKAGDLVFAPVRSVPFSVDEDRRIHGARCQLMPSHEAAFWKRWYGRRALRGIGILRNARSARFLLKSLLFARSLGIWGFWWIGFRLSSHSPRPDAIFFPCSAMETQAHSSCYISDPYVF